MELPRGITGFRHFRDPPLPVSDFRTFRGHCYAVARDLGGRVCSVEAPFWRGVANFAFAVLDLPTGRVGVALNAHFPVVGFAEPLDDSSCLLRFVDAPALAERFRGFGMYEVATAAELTRRLTPEMCQNLAPAEHDQVKHWRPGSVGELLFNFWD